MNCKLIRVGKIICGTVSNGHTHVTPALHNVNYSNGSTII